MTSTQLLGQHRGPLGDERLPWDDPAFELDPYPWYARVQAESPVFVDERGVFVVTKYEDVMTFGKQPSMSVEPGWAQAGPWAVVRETMIGRDDPDHTRLRRQTNKWFTPKLVQNWVTTTTAVTSVRTPQSHPSTRLIRVRSGSAGTATSMMRSSTA